MDRATRTCAEGIIIAKSKIRHGGKGAFTLKFFPKNTLFGPYEGVEVDRNDYRKIPLLVGGGYAWEVNNDCV